MDILRAIASLVVVALFAWFYHYLDKLEKIGCECALTKTRTLLMASIGVIVVLRLIDVVFPLPGLAQLLLSFASVAFVVLAFTYINKLKKEKCKCSESSTRKVMEVYIWIVVIIWVLALFLLAALFLGLMSAGVSPSSTIASGGRKLRTRK